MKRIRYEVVPCRPTATGNTWAVTKSGKRIATSSNQALSIKFAAGVARNDWKRLGKPAQLLIKRADGTIRDERTYGKDPRRTRG